MPSNAAQEWKQNKSSNSNVKQKVIHAYNNNKELLVLDKPFLQNSHGQVTVAEGCERYNYK